MALFRKLFYRKPPDGLLEISERVYVFDCCFTTETWEDKNYKEYIGSIIAQLRENFPDASFLVFNFRPMEMESVMSKILSEYDMTVMDYPCHYQGCPLLSMELVNHYLRSTESWLEHHPHNVLLMHCERGGWAVLAFMLAALLLYRKQYTGEHRTLDMVYKQAPHELLPFHCPLNPLPSQLRYLQYVARRNVAAEWPPSERALILNCVIIRLIPNFDGEGGCRPLFRIYGQDPLNVTDRASKLLFSTTKNNKAVRLYKQAESEIVKIDINCNVLGDIVLECSSLDEYMEREETMFRVMFNTAFIRSNILMLNREEVDTLWHTKENFPKDFRAEILFSDMDAVDSVVAAISSCFEEKEGLPVEAFAKVQEFFSQVDWLDSRADAALSVLQKISESHTPERSDEAGEEGIEGSTPMCKSNVDRPTEEQIHTAVLSNLGERLQSLSSDASRLKEKIEQNENEASEQPIKRFCSVEDLVDFSQSIKDIGAHVKNKTPRFPSGMKTMDGIEVNDSDITASNRLQSSSHAPSSVPSHAPQQSPATSPPMPPPPPLITENIQSKSQPPPPPTPPPPPPPSQPPSSPALSSTPSNREAGPAGSAQPLPPPTPGPPPPPPPPPQQQEQSILPSVPTTSAPPPPPPPSAPSSSFTNSETKLQNPSVPSAPPPPGLNNGNPKPGSAAIPAPPSFNAKSRGPVRSLGTKNAQAKKLKPLHWLKLNRAVKGSLWAETQKSGEPSVAPEIDMSELESLFSAAAPTAGRGTSGGKSSQLTQSKPDKVQLIDTRRACNCEIMLSKVKVPTEELMTLVLSLDESVMDADQVDNLIKFCPTKEEMDLLKNYNGERDKLGKCEQFFLSLMEVPRVEAKLRVFSFKIQFRTQVSELRHNLDAVRSASDQIRSSAKLKRIMQTVLSLGNALNQGTARGAAVGFRLDSLLKLNETRARNNKMTLMHYLCKVISEKLPELLDFSKDLTSLEPASKVQIKLLAEEMQSISKGLERVLQEFSSSENDGSVSDAFRKNLKEFICSAEAEVKSLALLYSGVGRKVDALITYFGEDPARCSFEQVVSTILNFTRMFDQAHEQNCKQLEMEKKKVETMNKETPK